jgi:hypothetical protein
MKKEEKIFSFFKGCSFKFEYENHVIRFWYSALTGLEKVYVDDELIASQRTLRTESTIPFKIGGVSFSISIKMHHLMKGPIICTLLKNGIPVGKKQVVFPLTFIIEYALIFSIITICAFGLAKGTFSLSRWFIVTFLCTIFILAFVIRKARGQKPYKEELTCIDHRETASHVVGQAERDGQAIPLTDEGWQPVFMGFLCNLKAGLRAAIFLKVDSSRFAVSEKQLLVLVGANLALTFLMNLIQVGINGELNLYYLPGTFFYLPLMVIASYWIAILESKHALKLSIPIALISAGLWIELAGNLVDFALKEDWLDRRSFLYGYEHYYRLFGWWLLSSCLLVYRLARPLRKPLQGGFVFLLILVIPFWFIPKWDLWTEIYNDTNAAQKDAIAKEEVFYLQPALLEKSLSAIETGRKGIVDLYFVGFGADASQDVFMNEIEVIKKLFDERFDTKGRSIALINNNQTVETTPIATRTSLMKSIDRIAMNMNKEEDVLFLYLTSHGSKTHNLSVEYWPLRLAEIRPQDIKEILDKAGITWKIIVVSACYSGGFIDPLKDDNTLIITSADANNTSLGCGNESDFTFFGKAYFDNALRKSFSFIAPFDEAKNEILKRERDLSETPSNPQIYIGARIQKQLDKLEFRLRSSFGSIQ